MGETICSGINNEDFYEMRGGPSMMMVGAQVSSMNKHGVNECAGVEHLRNYIVNNHW
jgi:hypothetical protein